MDYETLLSEVLLNPPVWDKKNKYYCNRLVTEKAWDAISNAMHAPKADCKKKFKYLKDEYRKALRKVPQASSGSEAVPHVSKFKYFELMSFLRDDSALSGDSNIEYLFDDIELMDDTSTTSIFIENVDSGDAPTIKNIAGQQQNTQIKKTAKRKTDIDDAYLDIERKKLKLLETDIERTNHEDSDDLHFFKSLLPHIEKFSTLQKMRLRSKIINEIVEITTDNLEH